MVNSEVPQEIKEKYRKGRKFVCEYAGKTVAHGIVEDYACMHKSDWRPTIFCVSFLHFSPIATTSISSLYPSFAYNSSSNLNGNEL
jgi:hypothetical protein